MRTIIWRIQKSSFPLSNQTLFILKFDRSFDQQYLQCNMHPHQDRLKSHHNSKSHLLSWPSQMNMWNQLVCAFSSIVGGSNISLAWEPTISSAATVVLTGCKGLFSRLLHLGILASYIYSSCFSSYL